ncbi:hypothetical protein BN946_scf184977.g3 [Trametes cinnabarina]|uniref:Protein kinase domain-containing protein n=1 Tax=Pycnoporus cinnabarinus TaxID=5643 RepID=A0A060SDQ3_PYCCI|nr:hypothetical protein BN946_scf184977.g3 [Trametes cinnabarina]
MFSFLTSWLVPSSSRLHLAELRNQQTQCGLDSDSQFSERDSSPEYVEADPISRRNVNGAQENLFFSALTAPYEPIPPPPRHLIHAPRPARASESQSCATIDWSQPQDSDDFSSDDEDQGEMDTSDMLVDPQGLLDRPAYQPVDKFSWAKGMSLVDTQLLYNIHVEKTYSSSLMKGRIGDRELMYICKRWTRAARPSWKGFYAELKLFSSPQYLRDMQGNGIPYLINVYSDPCAISFVMSLPHDSFWIEASADMPSELKKQVVLTYIALHARGVLHGAPELHNILIGGDGRVTLVNFHAARARKPIPELNLMSVTKAELDLELRQVMFKLDYEGARKREYAKRQRLQPLWDRLDECARRGLPMEKFPIDELRDPPPSREHWKADWINSLDRRPRRFVVPGQSPEEVSQACTSFCTMLQEWHELEKEDVVSPLIWVNPSPSSSDRKHAAVASLSSGHSSTTEHATPSAMPYMNPRKRKKESGPDDVPLPYKRVRGADLNDASISTPPRYERTTISYDTGDSVILLPAAITTHSEPKANRVRDFAYEPYDGPRGYYFPHPPTEARRDMMRAVYIRNANAIACGEQGLPYYRLDRWFLAPPSFKRRLVNGMHVSRGALKRQRDEAEKPVSLHEQRHAKKRRFEDDRRAALSEDRVVWFNDTVSYQDPPREEDYERNNAKSTSSVRTPQGQRFSGNTARPSRSILKPTRPVKSVSYDLANWGGLASLNAGVAFYTATSPFERLVSGMWERSGGNDSRLARYDRAIDERTGAPFRSGAEGARSSFATASETLRQTTPGFALTPDEMAVAAETSVVDEGSMLRASDRPATTHDLRSNLASGGDGGSRYDRKSVDDLEEEMEVEAILDFNNA